MPIFSRPGRPLTLSLLGLLLVACGGSGDGSKAGPTSEQLSEANTAGLHSVFEPATNRVTLLWYVNVTGASRYLIEQQDPSGAWVVVDGVWAPPNRALNGQSVYPQWTGVVNGGAATYRVEAVLPDGTVPLGIAGDFGASPPTSITVSAAAQLPSIQIDQPEPLENPVHISIPNSGAYYWVAYTVDTPPTDPFWQTTPWTITLDPTSFTTGTHLVYAAVALNATSTVLISRSVTVHTGKAALRLIDTLQTVGSLDFDLVATSDSGIVSVAGWVSGSPVVTVTAPNSCVPLPCASGQPFNAYRISIDPNTLGVGSPYFNAQATDGAVVAATLHVSGSFWSGSPGPLEVLVTLSGVPVYDTTVANTGANIPYSADVSLAGVAPGYHALNTYVRVGDTQYTATASAVIQVTAP